MMREHCIYHNVISPYVDACNAHEPLLKAIKATQICVYEYCIKYDVMIIITTYCSISLAIMIIAGGELLSLGYK